MMRCTTPLNFLLRRLAPAGLWLACSHAGAAVDVAVSSLAELAAAAARSDQTVTMKPGTYRVIDWIPLASIPERRKKGAWPLLAFTGNNNTFRLEGVTIELDTAVRDALHSPIHTDEFPVTGSGNTLTGLTITNTGDGKALGGAVIGITGKGNTLRDCTVRVQGSSPYGYGDLFGKGGHKHSGVHITGDGTSITGCRVYTRAFGHGFYVQEDAADVRFENCYVEGVMRSTDEMLKETAGLAVQRQFRTEMKNRSGEFRIMPGYMKALSEDAFRTYGQHRNLVLKNCTAKNMRGGFELRTKTAPVLENCTATGCERAFWVSTGAVLKNCSGDTQYGPLLFAEGDRAVIDVTLLPAASPMQVHALATIQGDGNRVTIRPSPVGPLVRELPVLVGYGTPGMGEGSAPIPEREARNVMLSNETAMPVVVGSRTRGAEIITKGPVVENKGQGVTVSKR